VFSLRKPNILGGGTTPKQKIDCTLNKKRWKLKKMGGTDILEVSWDSHQYLLL